MFQLIVLYSQYRHQNNNYVVYLQIKLMKGMNFLLAFSEIDLVELVSKK